MSQVDRHIGKVEEITLRIASTSVDLAPCHYYLIASVKILLVNKEVTVEIDAHLGDLGKSFYKEAVKRITRILFY